MSEIYDAKKDPQFSKGFIDIDEMRTRTLEDGENCRIVICTAALRERM